MNAWNSVMVQRFSH